MTGGKQVKQVLWLKWGGEVGGGEREMEGLRFHLMKNKLCDLERLPPLSTPLRSSEGHSIGFCEASGNRGESSGDI